MPRSMSGSSPKAQKARNKFVIRFGFLRADRAEPASPEGRRAFNAINWLYRAAC
jgi:hypothetical protein